MISALRLLAAIAALTLSADARAQDACQAFAWPVKREIAAFTSGKLPAITPNGAERALPEDGMALKLAPQASVRFAMQPERQPKNASAFAAAVPYLAPIKAGLYQVTLSGEAWVDVVQNGARVPPKAFSGTKSCAAVRKTVRFELAAAPFTVQVSDASADTLMVAILPAE
jgi:hypothetical protein